MSGWRVGRVSLALAGVSIVSGWRDGGSAERRPGFSHSGGPQRAGAAMAASAQRESSGVGPEGYGKEGELMHCGGEQVLRWMVCFGLGTLGQQEDEQK